MLIDTNDARALNAALSGLKVSLNHVRRLESNGVVGGDYAPQLEGIVAGLEAVRTAHREASLSGE